MVRTGAVIAQSLGGITPHENSTGMAYQLYQAFRIFHRQFQMFGGDAIRHFRSLLQILDKNHGTPLIE